MPKGYVAPMGRTTDKRRDVKSSAASVQVPVFTSSPQGDAIEGHIRVPLTHVRTKPFTNQRHEFTQYIAASIKKWVEWREHNGWRLNSNPKVRGPFDAPTANAQAEKPDYAIYTVTAFFLPTVRMTLGLDDAYELERRARVFGVDTSKPKPVATPLETGKNVIYDSGRFDNPMKLAEERRKALGMERDDLLIGPLDEPWAMKHQRA